MNQRKLYQWVRKVSKTWSGFSRHFQENVAVFSRGVAVSHSSQIRKIAGGVPGKVDSQRRRLQRFIQRQIDMEQFFGQWTRSIVRTLKLNKVVLAVDETKLTGRFGVMVIGLVFKGRCIPLAWRVYQANSAADYPQEGQVQLILNLLQAIQAGFPDGCQARVLADRGIGTSPDLMRGIMAMGWTFLFRVTKQSKIILPDGQALTFYDQVAQAGDRYAASGTVFKKRGHIPGHVRVLWSQDSKERWALVTNDPTLTGWEYAQRMWIEEAFRDLKSHGWRVEQAWLTCPQRMERLWILLVVSYVWLLLWGNALLEAKGGSALKRLPDGSYIRRWSLFQEGWHAFQRFTLHFVT
jgi:hypothetical protein